jgi:hypothetical protein
MRYFDLTKLIKHTWEKAGWIKKFNNYPNAYKFSERYHEKFIEEVKEAEKYYYQEELPKVWEEIDKWKAENPELVESFKNQIRKEKEIELETEKEELEKILYSDVDLRKKESKLKKIESIKNRLESKIDDEMIRKAKQYPIERVIKVENNFALCCWHNDKNPSMYCKNNYAHCFSCGKTGSVIDVYMEKNNCNFVEAVKELNQ